MRRWASGVRWCSVLVALAAIMGGLAAASGATMRMTLFAAADTVPFEQVRKGVSGTERALHGNYVRIGAEPGEVYWLRLRVQLPQLENGDRHWVLGLPRVPANELALYMPTPDGGWRMSQRRFYAPAPGEPPFPTGYGFRIPHDLTGDAELWLSVRSQIPIGFQPVLMPEAEYAAIDRQIALMLVAVYTGLLVLGLSGLALCIALRDGAYLSYVAFVATGLPLLLTANGHLYAFPVWSVLAAWEARGLCAIAFLAGAAALLLARDLASLRVRRPGMHRMLGRAAAAHAALGLVYLILPASQLTWAYPLAWAFWAATAGLCLFASLRAWADGRPLARPVTLVWLLMVMGIALRALMSFGVLAPGLWTLYGFQLALGAAAFLFSIALADRVMEFRFQRERIRQAKEQTDSHLQVEQVRRRLIERLQDELRESHASDVQWRAFHRMLEAIRALVPHRGALVVAYDYHGYDLMIPDPIQAKERYSRLVAQRGQTFRSVARSRLPMQVKIDDWAEAEGGGMFAVVPLQVPRPGWGAVLIERGDSELFQPDELQRVAELADLAANAADEAIAAAELKRRAELDPLTGAYNRRAMDHLLGLRTREAHAQRKPLSVLFVDLDHFKQVNDRHGHGIGDDCLRALADTIRSQLGPEDLFGRFGGEEFVVVLPGKPAEQARAMGERLRVAVSELKVPSGKGALQFTVSIGVAARLPQESQPKAIVERADKALYAAKRSGRNQVQVAAPPGSGENDAIPSPFL